LEFGGEGVELCGQDTQQNHQELSHVQIVVFLFFIVLVFEQFVDLPYSKGNKTDQVLAFFDVFTPYVLLFEYYYEDFGYVLDFVQIRGHVVVINFE
jgi:hypothetical protein